MFHLTFDIFDMQILRSLVSLKQIQLMDCDDVVKHCSTNTEQRGLLCLEILDQHQSY